MQKIPITKTWTEKFFEFFFLFFLFIFPWQTAFIFSETFIASAKLQWGTELLYLSEIVLWISIVLFFITVLRRRSDFLLEAVKRKKFRIVLIAFILCLSYSFLSALWAEDSQITFQFSLWMIESFFVFLLILYSRIHPQLIIITLLLGLSLSACLGIYQFLFQKTFTSTLLGLSAHNPLESGTSIVYHPDYGRILRSYGAFSHPNILGGISVMALPVLFLTLRHIRTIAEKFFTISLIGIFTFSLYTSFSRSAWLASSIFFIYSAVYFFTKNKAYLKIFLRYGMVFICTFISLAIFFLPLTQARIFGNNTFEERSIDERVSGYDDASQLFMQYRWLGTGIGNYTQALYKYDTSREPYSYQPVHNTFFLILIEWGIVGILTLLFLFFSLISFLKINKSSHFLVFIAFLPILLFDHYLYTSYIGLILIFAIMSYLYKLEYKNKK